MNQIHPTKIYLTAISLCAAFLLAPVAHATMPNLTPEPKPATPGACRAWATSQNDDAMDMWGIQEDGTSSPEVAVQRLTASCLGQPVPDIVGFGSSIGFNIYYCADHPKQKICLDTAESHAAEILANLDKNTADESGFDNFPVREIYKGRTYFPDFHGRDREFASFKTRIRNGLKDGPNFAGHYSIIEIGCGTGCKVVYIADNRTGKVFDFPRGGEDNQTLELKFMVSSRLVTAQWADFDKDECFVEFFWWDGSRATVIGKKTLGKKEACRHDAGEWKSKPATR